MDIEPRAAGRAGNPNVDSPGSAMVAGDFNGDGKMDLYVEANSPAPGFALRPTFLFFLMPVPR
jgi:hypothetical protein